MAAEGDCPSQFTGQSWSVWTEHLGPESHITEGEDQNRKIEVEGISNNCPSQFRGQPWSVWTEHLGRDSPISDEENNTKYQADAMRLPKEAEGEDQNRKIEVDAISYNCPSQFMGQPWSVWTEHLGRDSPISDEENDTKYQADAMRLPKEEMGLFGHCPERDPFYTVVCEFCDKSVKPQGLGNHMDLWHKVTTIETVPGAEPSEKIIKCSVGPKPGPGASPTPGNMKIKIKKPQNNSPGCVPMERLLSSNQVLANNILPAESVISLTKGADKILLQSENAIGMGRNQTVPSGPVSLQPVVALTPLHSANGLATIMSILPRLGFQAPCFPETLNTNNTNSTTMSSHNHSLNIVSGEQLNHSQRASGSPQKKRLKSDRLPAKEREYDPDKHCGVWNEESNKHCTRSLTCKTHSKSMQRAVTGRSKHFDKLLADHRAAKEVAGKLGKTLGIVQISGLDGDGGQLPQSVSISTNMVTDVPASCVGSLATPLSLSPDGQVNGIQNSSSDSQCASYPASVPPPPTLPNMTVDSFTPVTSVSSIPCKTSVLSSAENFTPGACHLPRPPEELASLKFVPRLEDVTWLRSHPKPVTVCSFSARKIGDVVANNRRVEVFCHRLKTALTQGCIRIPHSIQRTGKEKVLTVRQKPVAQRVVFHS